MIAALAAVALLCVGCSVGMIVHCMVVDARIERLEADR